jgi:hypothetical protein
MTTRRSSVHHVCSSVVALLMIDDVARRRLMGPLDCLNNCPVVIFDSSMGNPDLLMVRVQDRIGSP